MGFTPSLHRARSRWTTIAIAAASALFASVLVAVPAPAHALSDTGTGGQFVPLQQRVFDSRTTTWGNAATPVKKSGWTSISVAGANGVPLDIGAVQVTLTEVDASANGVVYADKTGVSTPNTSMPYLTWYDSNVSNTAILAVGDDGGIQVSTNVASMNLIVDVQGYYTAGDTTAGGYVPLKTATRVWSSGTTKYAANQTVDVAIGGQAGVPANASSAMINIITSGSTSGTDGYLVPYAAGSAVPTYSSMNWSNGQNAEFTAPVKLGTNGKITIKIKAGGSVALSVGIQGYFTATSGTAVLTPAHTRVYDSRSTAPVAQVAAGATRKIQVAGVSGVPVMGSGITAAAVNIYVISGATSGHVNVSADDAAMGDDAQQFYTNRITYGFTTVKLGADGGINLKNYATTPIDVLIDVEGWFSNPSAPTIACAAPYGPGSWASFPAENANAVSCDFTAPPASATGQNLYVWIDGDELDPIVLSASSRTYATYFIDAMEGVTTVSASVGTDDAQAASSSVQFGVGDWSSQAFDPNITDGSVTYANVDLMSSPAQDGAFPTDSLYKYSLQDETSGLSIAQTDWTSNPLALTDRDLVRGHTYVWSMSVQAIDHWLMTTRTSPSWKFTVATTEEEAAAASAAPTSDPNETAPIDQQSTPTPADVTGQVNSGTLQYQPQDGESTASTNGPTVKSNGVIFGPCTLKLQNTYLRRSRNYTAFTTKPSTTCTQTMQYIKYRYVAIRTHYVVIVPFYGFYGPTPTYSKANTKKFTDTEYSHSCLGFKPTIWSIGVTGTARTYGGRVYGIYGRSLEAKLDCGA